MRVLKATDDQFILEDRPLFLGLVLVFFILSCAGWMLASLFAGEFGMALLAAAATAGLGAIAALCVQRVWLILDRKAGTIELRRRGARGFRSESFALADLDPDGILVQANEEPQRLALRLASRQEPVPMTTYYRGGGSISRCAEAARKWLAGVTA